jgi:hypothetical protein
MTHCICPFLDHSAIGARWKLTRSPARGGIQAMGHFLAPFLLAGVAGILLRLPADRFIRRAYRSDCHVLQQRDHIRKILERGNRARNI